MAGVPRAAGSVERGEPCAAGMFGGLLSANTTYLPRLRSLVASWRGAPGTFSTDYSLLCSLSGGTLLLALCHFLVVVFFSNWRL